MGILRLCFYHLCSDFLALSIKLCVRSNRNIQDGFAVCPDNQMIGFDLIFFHQFLFVIDFDVLYIIKPNFFDGFAFAVFFLDFAFAFYNIFVI